MSNVLGIIAEYNPFHNGHLYHLQESKEKTNARYCVCVMSGNFVQRGEPAIIDKWARAKIAIENGIDMVIELPTIYSISSAENFAYGGIRLLDSIGVVTHLSFGSENGNINVLSEISSVLATEPKEYVSLLKHELDKGISFPRARENALLMYLNDIRRYANVMASPNNILGIEYLKSIKKLNSSITPITIERNSAPHDSSIAVGSFASSSAIRQKLAKEQNIKSFIPYETSETLEDCISHGKFVNGISAFEKEIIYALRKMSLPEIAMLPDVSEGLENKIKEASNECNSVKELINIIKSKRYTETRIQRILIYALLGVTKLSMIEMKAHSPYVRILGMNNKGKELLSQIKYSHPRLPIITSVKDFVQSNKNKTLKSMLDLDIKATDIYTLAFESEPYAKLDFTKKLVIL